MLCPVWDDIRGGGALRIEEVVGRRIREAREARGLSQDEFGQLLAELLGRPWPRQAISAAEKGNRAFTAAEVFAFSVIIGCDVASLFRLPGDLASLQLPGEEVTRERLDNAMRSEMPNVGELRLSMSTLLASAQDARDLGAEVEQAARKASDELDRVLTGIEQARPAGE